MKKILILFCFALFTNCLDSTIVNDCFDGVSVSGTINLSNPQFIELQVPLGYVPSKDSDPEVSIDGRSLLIINSTSSYKAYDLECPEKDCSSNMSFDGLKLVCKCSGKEYNSLNGSPIDTEGCFALEYNVIESGNTLQISR